MRRLTTNNLIEDCRSLLDEQNQESIDDEDDILPALNRGQDLAANILARHYESPLLAYVAVTLNSSDQEYDIPEDAFEQRIEKVEININGSYSECRRVSYRDATALESTASASIPLFYSEVGLKYRLFPKPTGSYAARVWYLKDPAPLAKEQGTITSINSGSNYIVVSDLGSDLTTTNDSFNSYVSFIDGQTGKIKGACQIQTISGSRITFKTSATRSTVLNQTISNSIPSTVEQDDLICVVGSTCVPLLKKPFSQYMIDFAVSELLNIKLGIPSDLAEQRTKQLEKIVEKSWVGREQYLRVKNVSPHFTKRRLRR